MDSGLQIHRRILCEPVLGFYRSQGTLQRAHLGLAETFLPRWVLAHLDQCSRQDFEVTFPAELALAFGVYPEQQISFSSLNLCPEFSCPPAFSCFCPCWLWDNLKDERESLISLLVERHVFSCDQTQLWYHLGNGPLMQWMPIQLAAECVRSPTDCRPQGNNWYLSELFATTCWATDLLLKVLHIYNILKKII